MPDTQKRGKSSARLGVVLFALAALMSFGVGLTLAAPPFTATIVVDDITDLTVAVSGTADSPSNATHYMEIAWGDGDTDVLPNFSTDAPWSWGPVSHTYASGGDYTITATLIHANSQGNDRGTASDSADISLPEPCDQDCPSSDDGDDDGDEECDDGDDGDDDTDGDDTDVDDDDCVTDDDGSDDGSDDGEVVDGVTGDDGSVEPQTEVKGTTFTKKPAVKGLAKTGPEHTGLVVIGLMLLMAGATIRLVTSDQV